MSEKSFEILRKLAAQQGGAGPAYARQALDFVESGDESLLASLPVPPKQYPASFIWNQLAKEGPWSEPEQRLARLAVESAGKMHSNPDASFPLQELLREMERHWREHRSPSEPILVDFFKAYGINRLTVARAVFEYDSGRRTWGTTRENHPVPEFDSELERWLSDADDPTLAEMLWWSVTRSRFPGMIARFKPSVIPVWWSMAASHPRRGNATEIWKRILPVNADFDQECLQFATTKAAAPDRFQLLHSIFTYRGSHRSELVASAIDPDAMTSIDVISWILNENPLEAVKAFTTALSTGVIASMHRHFRADPYPAMIRAAARFWNQGGRELIQALRSCQMWTLEIGALQTLLDHPPESHDWPEVVVSWLKDRPVDQSGDLWTALVAWLNQQRDRDPESLGEGSVVLPAFAEALWQLLGSSSSQLRALAAEGLIALLGEAAIPKAVLLLCSGKVDQKLGAVSFLQQLGSPSCGSLLSAALANESSDKVRAALHSALASAGQGDSVKQESAAQPDSLETIEKSLASPKARQKLPATSWLKPETLPQVLANDGTPLSPQAVVFLIAKQSKHKTLDAAPDLQPLLSHIDRGKSAPFALALVEGFLNSEQAAADRWALALGGLLGDKRIIPPLLSRIPDWCENSRHKLAEYAAQAIALLPGNEPLTVLDTLANRYRSKFKNVGKACAEAFAAAAAARGITPDELGDLVVPDFGFDADGLRLFEWEGGRAGAELGADLKISWSDPDTYKSWKALPASASAEVKDEVKTLGKLLREAVKGQTARLEMALVRQRRWPVTRWRELYENHPLLRSFASGLVWGIYDAPGSLLRTFRRYPNGLLANATGELEELPESDTSIGMVHPLELDASALDAWRAHLGRFKVKQPFPQLDRPVELLDPLHANRRAIALTKDKTVGWGSFRTKAEKRGWVRGSVIDAGGIASYYKPYSGAGVEVILPAEGLFVGYDPMDSFTLGAAYFVKADSVERGSYTYDDPGPDDPRVLRFDQVPAVVWSETMADLKAIIGAETGAP